MDKKQTMGLVIAAIIFVVTASASVLVNTFANNKKNKSFMEELMDSVYSSSASFSDMPVGDFVAIVPIQGIIQASSDNESLFATTVGYDHKMLLKYVDTLMKNSNNKGMVLKLNTPGGTVYEADELYLKIKEYKETTGRPIWAYMENQCCSGGVYIASIADEQYANRITTTGSIGVIWTTYSFKELYEKLGIEEIHITSGKNKAMGAAGENMTSEQLSILQGIVDEYYENFVEIVADGRNKTTAQVKELADGRIYTAKQAQENGLIDGIKTYEDFRDYVLANVEGRSVRFYEPKQQPSYFSSFFGSVKQLKPKSEIEATREFIENLGSGGPMYYANPIGE